MALVADYQADAYNAVELAEGRITAQHLTDLVRLVQSLHPELNLVADGKLGPETRRVLDHVRKVRSFLR